MSLERLDRIIPKEEQKVKEYIQRSEEKITALREETSQNLRISQVVKAIPTNIDEIVNGEITTTRIKIKTEDNSYFNILDFEHGNTISLEYSNYRINLSPKKIEVNVYGASDTREFKSFPLIEGTYNKVASELSKAINIIKENQLKEDTDKETTEDSPF